MPRPCSPPTKWRSWPRKGLHTVTANACCPGASWNCSPGSAWVASASRAPTVAPRCPSSPSPRCSASSAPPTRRWGDPAEPVRPAQRHRVRRQRGAEAQGLRRHPRRAPPGQCRPRAQHPAHPGDQGAHHPGRRRARGQRREVLFHRRAVRPLGGGQGHRRQRRRRALLVERGVPGLPSSTTGPASASAPPPAAPCCWIAPPWPTTWCSTTAAWSRCRASRARCRS